VCGVLLEFGKQEARKPEKRT